MDTGEPNYCNHIVLKAS